jgi:CRP/FNR family cyclic AMP-dependent transcriptional regulator
VSLKDISRGEYFGELALFDDKPRSASALATTDAVLLELSRATLSAYLERRPRAAMAILRTMGERLRETNTLLSERAAKNAVKELEDNLSWSDQLADKVAELNGSWKFIGALIGLTIAWTFLNTRLFLGAPFDGYPYTFFNLLLAILVALQGPLIVMSQNRQTLKDRAQAETDFKVNLKNEVNIESILREIGEFRAEANRRLEALEGAPGRAAGAAEPSRLSNRLG